jgi:excisionase family DNA binding protein
MATDERYLTCDEVGEVLQMSAEWVRRQCNAGNLVGTKLGRAWRVKPSDLETFMRRHRGGQAPAARTRVKGSKRRVA